MSPLALAVALLASSSPVATKDNGIAVLDLQGTGISPELLPTLTEVLTGEISET